MYNKIRYFCDEFIIVCKSHDGNDNIIINVNDQISHWCEWDKEGLILSQKCTCLIKNNFESNVLLICIFMSKTLSNYSKWVQLCKSIQQS